MEEMIIIALKYCLLPVFTLILGFLFRRKAAEVKIALDWEDVNEKRHKSLLSDIAYLKNKLTEIAKTLAEERIIHYEEVRRWENSDLALRDDLTKCRKLNGTLQEKLEICRNKSN